MVNDNILALQQLPAIDTLGVGPHAFQDEEDPCTVCSFTCTVTAAE